MDHNKSAHIVMDVTVDDTQPNFSTIVSDEDYDILTELLINNSVPAIVEAIAGFAFGACSIANSLGVDGVKKVENLLGKPGLTNRAEQSALLIYGAAHAAAAITSAEATIVDKQGNDVDISFPGSKSYVN